MTGSQGADEPRRISEHELNPVGRLYLYLDHVRTRADNEDLVQCVASYIHVSRNDLQELYGAAFELTSLRDDAAELVSSTPGLPGSKAALAELERIEIGFRSTMVLNGAVVQFKNAYDPGALRTLEIVSETVNQWRRANPEAAQGGIDGVRQALLDLCDQLRTDDSIDQGIRALLLAHAHKLSACVDQFYIGGVDALLDELKKLFGEFALDSETQKQAG